MVEIIQYATKIVSDYSAKIFAEKLACFLYQHGHVEEATIVFISGAYRKNERSIILDIPTSQQMRQLKNLYKWIEKNAPRFDPYICELELRSSDTKKTINILLGAPSMSFSGMHSLFPKGIHVGNNFAGFISEPIFEALQLMYENPEQRYILVRLLDQRQVAMTRTCIDLIADRDIDKALTRKREDYFYRPHLEELNRLTNAAIEAGRENTSDVLRYQYILTDPETRSNWRQMDYEYRLLRGSDGLYYQLAHCLDWKPCKEPVLSN